MEFPYSPDNYCLEESIGCLLARARAVLTANVDRALAQFDLTHAQFVIFLKLQHAGAPMTVGDLAREWHYDTGAMTRMLDRLEEKGFAVRSRSQADRRVVLIELSDKGRALAGQMSRVAIDALNHQLQGFSLEEVEQFKGFLRRMVSNG